MVCLFTLFRGALAELFSDPVVTPENFAQSVVDDYTLPTSYHSVIVKSIQDQLSDFKAHSSLFPDGDEGEAIVEDVLCVGGLSEEDVAWWESWRKRLRTPAGFVRSGRRKGLLRGRKRRKLTTVRTAAAAATAALASDTEWDEEEKPMDVGAFKLDEDQLQDDLRIVIKVCLFWPAWGAPLWLTVCGRGSAGCHRWVYEAG
jgi:SWI/SNF-related matrix-associated actin-dependent regulator of chromatin subfamily B protein 1